LSGCLTRGTSETWPSSASSTWGSYLHGKGLLPVIQVSHSRGFILARQV
jgi:hypothetical protein